MVMNSQRSELHELLLINNTKKMNTLKYTYSIALIFTFQFSIIGQVDTTRVLTEAQTEAQSQLGNEELEVIKAFKAKLATASSLDVNPTIEPAPPVNRDYDYRITIVPYDINYEDPTIKPFAMKPDAKPDFNKGYAKLGFGNYKSPLADLSYHNTSGKVEYGLMANYLALDNSDNNAYQKMSDIDVDIHANLKLTDNLELLTGAYTSIDQRYFFHIPINEASLFSEDAALRNLNTYGIRLGIQNGSNYALQYRLMTDANYMTITNDDTNEINTNLKGMISYAGKSIGISLDAEMDFSQVTESVDSSFLTLAASPKLFWSNEKFNIQAGASTILANDEVYIFPSAELLLDILSDKMQIVAGVDQEYIHNSISNVVSYNPYYQASQGDYGTTITKSYYGGAQGEWAKLTYRGKIGYREILNQAILVNAFQDARKFDLGYIDMNSIFIEATASYSLNEIFTIGGGFQQNIFDLEENVIAYHLPSMRYNAYTVIHLLNDNLTIRPTLAFTDRVEYINENGAIEKLDPMLSLNTSVNYKVGNHFGLFVDAKNLLANNYAEYYGYDDVGIHVHGGITLKF